MVYQGSDVLREHLWCPDINTVRRFLVHVLDAVWILQQAVALLGFGALCSSAAAGSCPTGLFLASLPDPAAERKHSGVRSTVNAFLCVENLQGRLYCDLWLVHPGRGMAAELNLLQTMPWSVQAVAGSYLHSCSEAANDSHCLLPLVPSSLPGRTTSA